MSNAINMLTYCECLQGSSDEFNNSLLSSFDFINKAVICLLTRRLCIDNPIDSDDVLLHTKSLDLLLSLAQLDPLRLYSSTASRDELWSAALLSATYVSESSDIYSEYLSTADNLFASIVAAFSGQRQSISAISAAIRAVMQVQNFSAKESKLLSGERRCSEGDQEAGLELH